MGLTACNAQVAQAFMSAEPEKTFFHGHSYTANPLACAAALSSLNLLLAPACTEARNRINASLKAFAGSLAGHKLLTGVRVIGTILALEVQAGNTEGYFSNLRNYLYKFFLNRGILLRPLGNTLYILPPYIITDAQLQQIYTALLGMAAELEAVKKS